MTTETIVLNEHRKVTLTAYIQQVGGEFAQVLKRPAVLILPGGAYGMCSDREADPVAFAYLKAGYQAFILRYSVADNKTWPNPLDDYEKAISFIREKSDEWGVYSDKIAVIGFSAGGHLAAVAATSSKNRPNAAILGYPALIKETGDMCQKGMPVPVEQVDDKTCPCFVFATRNDWVVPVKNTVEFLQALIAKNITFESHIYSYGNHGYSTGEQFLFAGEMCNRAKNWVADSIEWLKDVFGDFSDGGMTTPKVQAKMNGNNEEYLSMDCTYGYLKSQSKEVVEILQPLFIPINASLGGAEEKFAMPLKYVKACDIATMLLKMPLEKIDELNGKLNKIKNNKGLK